MSLPWFTWNRDGPWKRRLQGTRCCRFNTDSQISQIENPPQRRRAKKTMSRCFLKPTQKKQRAWKTQPGTLYELSQKIIQKSLGASQSPLNRVTWMMAELWNWGYLVSYLGCDFPPIPGCVFLVTKSGIPELKTYISSQGIVNSDHFMIISPPVGWMKS